MTQRLLPLLFPLAVACSGGDDDKAATGDTDTSDTDTDPYNTIIDSSDTGIFGDDDDDTEVTDTWDMTVPCDTTHTLSTLVLETEDERVYVDLDTAAVVTASDGWEISIDQWEVEMNAGVEVALTNGTYDAFDSLCQAPPEGFSGDATPLTRWYIYDPSDHTLTPQDEVYFLKTTDGAYMRLRFDGYYESKTKDIHTPGLTFGPVAAPGG